MIDFLRMQPFKCIGQILLIPGCIHKYIYNIHLALVQSASKKMPTAQYLFGKMMMCCGVVQMTLALGWAAMHEVADFTWGGLTDANLDECCCQTVNKIILLSQRWR